MQKWSIPAYCSRPRNIFSQEKSNFSSYGEAEDTWIFQTLHRQIHSFIRALCPNAIFAYEGLYIESFPCLAGSPWVILSRSFLEFCIFGWDNLPRTLLMYFTNVKLSQEGYFHSVICNAPEFKNTTVNGDLRYMIWDNPPKMEPHSLNVSVYSQMVESGAAFARQFEANDPVLDMIDEKILHRGRNRAVPGAWCSGRRSWWMDPCSRWGNVNVLKPGPQAKKLEETVSSLLDDWSSQTDQCNAAAE